MDKSLERSNHSDSESMEKPNLPQAEPSKQTSPKNNPTQLSIDEKLTHLETRIIKLQAKLDGVIDDESESHKISASTSISTKSSEFQNNTSPLSVQSCPFTLYSGFSKKNIQPKTLIENKLRKQTEKRSDMLVEPTFHYIDAAVKARTDNVKIPPGVVFSNKFTKQCKHSSEVTISPYKDGKYAKIVSKPTVGRRLTKEEDRECRENVPPYDDLDQRCKEWEIEEKRQNSITSLNQLSDGSLQEMKSVKDLRIKSPSISNKSITRGSKDKIEKRVANSKSNMRKARGSTEKVIKKSVKMDKDAIRKARKDCASTSSDIIISVSRREVVPEPKKGKGCK